MRKSKGAALVLVIAFAVTIVSGVVGAYADAAAGAATFKAKCAMCHGPEGDGKGKLRDLRSADVQKQTDAQLTQITAKGKGKMPAYEKKLSADEIKNVVEYMRSIAKK
jgi:cytochrome c6